MCGADLIVKRPRRAAALSVSGWKGPSCKAGRQGGSEYAEMGMARKEFAPALSPLSVTDIQQGRTDRCKDRRLTMQAGVMTVPHLRRVHVLGAGIGGVQEEQVNLQALERRMLAQLLLPAHVSRVQDDLPMHMPCTMG